VVHTDINAAMLRVGRDRLLDAGVVLPTVVCDAEKLPFAAESFDRVSVGFGLRNMTHKDPRWRRCTACSSRAASCWCWSSPRWRGRWRRHTTGTRSTVLPRLGRLVAGDEASYRYLAESIRMHPGQEELKAMMKKAGFGHVDYHNLTGGVAALHVAIKC
jgi:demethylmenaquinone methyltransferase/2-methoxy-6-polyprenyl-1,4-benzoquinol methylase